METLIIGKPKIEKLESNCVFSLMKFSVPFLQKIQNYLTKFRYMQKSLHRKTTAAKMRRQQDFREVWIHLTQFAVFPKTERKS